MNTKVPFVDFYESNNISPVSQNITDIKRHYERRESLFRSLGLNPLFLKNLDIIEFGCGSGHNAIYTASLRPNFYQLVDGNAVGIEESKKRLCEFENVDIKITHSLFQKFKTKKKFDIVWAEGCIPHQSKPLEILQHISSFVKTGGILCVSTASATSYLSETIRRLFRARHFPAYDGDALIIANQILPYMTKHLSNLKNMSRPHLDWILDSIVQPMHDRKMFSIPDLANALDGKFEIYGTSPKYILDWRWYKDLYGRNKKYNEIAVDSYYSSNLNLLDYRQEYPAHPRDFGERLEDLCLNIWDLMRNIESGADNWSEINKGLGLIKSHIQTRSPETAIAIDEAIIWINSGDLNFSLSHLPAWWGRGQQYVSLIKI